MVQDKNKFYAEDGKLIVRKSDDFIMGDGIDLGSEDSIDNYEERVFSEEEANAFWESVGVRRDKPDANRRGKKPSNEDGNGLMLS